ncbi:MAG: radical SAM family heme chaperone HemW [Victivallales bacterium]
MIKRIYIHVPFCASKCGYCAFYSLPSPEPGAVDSYLKKLAHDFKSSSHLCGKLESVFIGGGTPTFLSAENLGKLFSLIHSHFEISADAEFSIECNPETLTAEKSKLIANFANRVSLGVQSFNPEFRRILGRQGSVSTIEKAISLLTKHGVVNIGCDLIYAIPGQSPEDWQSDLEKTVAFPLKHISAYSLTFEEGTRLAEKISKLESRKSKLENKDKTDTRHLKPESSHRRLTTDDCSAEMWNLANTFLKKHGFRRYEISNYAKRGSECRHNLEIWYGDKYLGFGPAAASFDGIKRWTNVGDLQKWLSGTEPEIDLITPEKRAREIFVMGLRTSQGWDRICFLRRTGFDLNRWNTDLAPLTDTHLLIEAAENIKCTRKGLLLWNEVAERLI